MSLIRSILPGLLSGLLNSATEARGSILLPGAVAETVHTMGEFATKVVEALHEKAEELEQAQATIADHERRILAMEAAQEASTANEAAFLEKLAELEARLPKA